MSAQSVTEPIPQFHNRDGQPLDGGFIYVGQAGLDAQANQIQLYRDPALTLPLSQPVLTLNGYASDGPTPIAFYAAVGDFSIKLLDANGTLVLSAPNVTTRLDAANLTGSISAALISFLQFGTGAVARTVQDKLRDTVSVFDFMTAQEIAGVKAGTFLVDVTAPINAAISSGAREIFFPQGGYVVSSPINIGATSVGVSLVGAGRQATVIRNYGGPTPAIQSIGNVILNNTSIRIADMSLEGSTGTGAGILLRYTSQAVIERVDSYANGADGIAIELCAHVAVNDCWCRANEASGLYVGPDSYFIDVKGGTFEASPFGSGVTVAKAAGALSPRYVTLVGCAFRANAVHNVSIGEARDVRIFGCSFETSSSYATTRHVSVNGGTGLAAAIVVDACTFFGNNATTTLVGLYANACEDVSVLNSVVDCTGSTAYNLTASALRTRIFDNAVLFGTRTNASASTVVRDVVSAPTPGVAYFTGTSALPISMQAPNNVPLVRFDAQRVWANANNVFTFNATPASISDGYVVGPGCGDAADFSFLPALPPMGTIYRCRGCNSGSWGTAATAVGAFDQFLIWTGTRWTVIGAV